MSSVAKYLDLGTGDELSADDAQRGVWYSAGQCGYWTDDWSKLSDVGGIPCCPECHMLGMQIEYQKWIDGATKYAKDHPGYVEFCLSHKEICGAKLPGKPSWMDRYER